jgi:ASC-1-like (ASCH) protein
MSSSVVSSWEVSLLTALTARGVPQQGGCHLAIMVEPYMSRVEAGTKVIESRWGKTRQPPYDRVVVGDTVVFKRSGGLLTGWARVYAVHCSQVNAPQARDLVRKHEAELAVDAATFAEAVADKSYATLVWLERFQPFKRQDVENLVIGKRDQRGWVVLRPG